MYILGLLKNKSYYKRNINYNLLPLFDPVTRMVLV